MRVLVSNDDGVDAPGIRALAAGLREAGHEVMVVMPKYSSINAARFGLHRYWESLGVWMGTALEWCAVDTAAMGPADAAVPVYFIEQNRYFDRPGLYHDADYNDFQDNPYRFGFLTRAGLQLARDMGFHADIVHVHDWQAALAPAYLKIWHWNDAVLGKAASLLTIHNIAYQGRYNAACYPYLGLGWNNYVSGGFQDYDSVNFLKGGIHWADMVNTVSPTYAAETRTAEYGYGLAPYLNNRGNDYLRIVNGVDYNEWNPAVDLLLPAQYTADDLSGKAICKAAMQKRFLLDEAPGVPVVGIVSRFAEQKGLHLLAECIDGILSTMHVQFVILGSGEPGLQDFFGHLPSRYPGRVGSFIGYSNELAHLIEAGSDFFLMPSIYEPCGLNQIYSLKYGTLPIVRATGGLDDTVIQYDEQTGTGTGFKFWSAAADAVYFTVGWAVSTYYDRPQQMAQMIQQAMAQDYSWERSAEKYLEVYARAMANKPR